MFDIDHFKSINDTYGHQVGDAVIQQVAELIRENLRDSDVAGRYGGEEFVVLLPDTDKQGALTFAERLRHAVESHEVQHEQHRIRFTISLGVADLSVPSSSHAQLIEWADSALYAPRRQGAIVSPCISTDRVDADAQSAALCRKASRATSRRSAICACALPVA